MYELSLAQELYCCSRVRADAIGAGELESVRISVGELSGADPDLLRAAWKFVTLETADENVSLQIEMQPARQVCPQCGAIAPQEIHPHLCHCEQCKCHMRVDSGAGVKVMEIRFQQQLTMH